jgi:hypothetical protein
MNRSTRMLLLAFAVPVLAVGATYWTRPYAELQLPSALLWWPVVLVFFGAVASRLAGAGFFASWMAPGAALPVVVLVRIVRDTAADPTTHNLWPLEFLIADVLGFGAAFLGVVAAVLSLKARTPAAGGTDGT